MDDVLTRNIFFWYSCPIVNHMVTHVLTICMHLLSTSHQLPCLLTYLQGNHVNHLEKICSVCGGHLISINLSPWNWEGYCAYSSRMGGKLCLLVTVRTLMLWWVGIISLPFIRLVTYISMVHDTIGKAHGLDTFLKCKVGLNYCLVLGPFLRTPPP
jgi:hypothetical protein